jgi:hypothetical protein
MLKIALLTVATLGLLFGWSKNVKAPDNKQDLELKFLLSKHQLVPNDTVWFDFRAINHTPDSIKLVLPSPEAVLFKISDKNNAVVWRSDYGVMFAQMLTYIHIPPKDSLTFKAFWTGKDNLTKFQTLGKYYVESLFFGTKTSIKDSLWLVD